MPETAVKILFERYGPKYRAFVTFTVVLGIVSKLLKATTINVAIPVIIRGLASDRTEPIGWPRAISPP